MNNTALPAFSQASQSVVIGGIYEHYKKKSYQVLAIARHSESLEELVVYKALYGEGSVWVRPLALFLDSVFLDGLREPRFTYLPDSQKNNLL